MSRILVLMDHKENRRLLAEWLATRYTVLPEDTERLMKTTTSPSSTARPSTGSQTASRPEEVSGPCVPPFPSRDRRAAGRLGDPALVEEH